MLTHSSDPLPQIVCPMDEDAIPQNSFCSAPPHSVPPPPLLPLSSVTPSFTYDGSSGHRRSGRIQAQTPKKQSSTDIEAAQLPARQNRSPSKRQRGAGNMVQVPQSEQQRVASTYRREKQNEERCDLSFATKGQNKQTDQRISQMNPNLSAAGHIETFADKTTHNLDSSRLAMDTCGGIAVGHGVENAPKGWVIGPLFQSFKSKMASFTEIVMSPVKLFRLPPSTEQSEKTDECKLETDGTPDVDLSEQNDVFGNDGAAQMDDVENTKIVKYSKRLSFNAEPRTESELKDECLMEQKKSSSANSVPFLQNPLCHFVSEKDSDSLESSVHEVASPDSALEETKSTDDQKSKLTARLKPLPRKCSGNRRKIASKVLVSEVIMETQEEVIDEGLSHVNVFKSGDYKSPPFSSSVVLSPPDEDSAHVDNDNGEKTDLSKLVRPNIRSNVNESTKKRMLRPALETSLNPETPSCAGSGRAKRERRLDSNSQDFVKRKRLAVQKDPPKQDGVMPMGLRTPRKDVSSVDDVDTTKPAQKGLAVSTRANSKGKSARGMPAAIIEEGLNVSEDASHAMMVCSLDKSSGVAEVTQKGSGRKAKTSVVNKRPGTTKNKCEETVDKSMDLETTLTVAQPRLSEALTRPDIKQLKSPRVLKRKQLKRKSPNHAESDSTPVSTSSLTLPLELTPTGFSASQQEESRNTEPKKPSKRPKKSPRGAVKPSASYEETNEGSHNDCSTTKDNQVEKVDPVYFEMTPSENPSTPLLTQQHAFCYVKLDNIEQSLAKEKEKNSVTVVEEVFPSEAEAGVSSNEGISRLRSFARGVNSRPRRVDKQRRRCRVFPSWTRKGSEMTDSVTMEDADLSTRSSESSPSRNLLRSYSCPEIPSLRHHDTSWTSSLHSPHHSRVHTPHHHHTSHSHKSLRRARRHTVCSLEVERELAPLCLRKEVYPARRSVPYDASTQHLSPVIALSPTTSLTALASCFLSSPLAFLSKKEKVAVSPSTSSRASSPSSAIHPLSPSTWRLPGFLQRSDPSSPALNTSCSGNPLECELERRAQSEEDDDGEDTSSSSQEFEDAALREEKSLSDSEIKVVQKREERGKVSSIRIRKTLPKPQNNLTPMGLPKPIRLKKKEFSLEEIYTNKNFSKPPESRLETIFEVPLNRRNGSETWFGQRRLKRFLEFLEVGEARKPKKPLVGLGKAGNSSSRTRRGAFPKEEPTLSVQDVDSLLCAKLDQLSLWLTHDQRDS